MLVEQLGAQIALAALPVHQAGLHGRLAHALDELAHEQRLELLGGFLERGLALVPRLARAEAQCIERARIAGEALGGRKGGVQMTSSSAFIAPAALIA
ncbi:hypothetical protein D3C86_1894620 [compost metagenome]